MKSNLVQPLSDLLLATGKAHHQAFIETDGDDPEWPLWYAQRMRDDLNALLQTRFTVSELVYLILAAEKQRLAAVTTEPWPDFYASIILSE